MAKTSPKDADLHEKVTALFRQYDCQEVKPQKEKKEVKIEDEFKMYKLKIEIAQN